MISDFSSKKLVQYLEEGVGKTHCIYFNHGLGDVVMFMPLYKRLKEMFPQVDLNFMAGEGQDFFNDVAHSHYDLEFDIQFYESGSPEHKEGGWKTWLMSKPETCCCFELGIPFDKSLEFTYKPEIKKHNFKIPENTIGIVYNVNSNAHRCMPYIPAKQIWDVVCKYATPLEIHFETPFCREMPRFNFVKNTCRSVVPSIENVFDIISQLKGFIGVNTGTFCSAFSMDIPTLHMYFDCTFYPRYSRLKRTLESQYYMYGIIKDDIEDFVKKCLSD